MTSRCIFPINLNNDPETGTYQAIPEETPEELREYEEEDNTYSEKDIMDALQALDAELESDSQAAESQAPEPDAAPKVTFSVPEPDIYYMAFKTIELPESVTDSDKRQFREMMAAESEAMSIKPRPATAATVPDVMSESDWQEFKELHAAEAKALEPQLKEEFVPLEDEPEECYSSVHFDARKEEVTFQAAQKDTVVDVEPSEDQINQAPVEVLSETARVLDARNNVNNEYYILYNTRKWAFLYTVMILVFVLLVLLGYILYKEFA